MPQRRFRRWLLIPAAIVVILILVVVFFQWDWLIPVVEAQASAALGRPVTIAHLHGSLGRVVHVDGEQIEVANPKGFPDGSHFATIDRLGVDVDVWDYVRHQALRIPNITVDHPVVAVATSPSGEENWKLATGSSSSGGSGASSPQIGTLIINDGHATVKVPKMKADFAMDVATHQEEGREPQIIVTAKGAYAGQPITGRFVGGSLLSLRDPSEPYPIDLHVANGPTHVALIGTVQDPLAFKGTAVKLELAGPDMSALYPLTGIPIPETPPYKIVGNLDYGGGKIRFDKFSGTVGRSDLNGYIHVDPGKERPQVDADLTSRRVDLNDLAGFIGSTPGGKGTAQTSQQKKEHAQADASPTLLPDKPFNIPKLKAADFTVKYRGEHIEGESMPLDNLLVNLTIEDADIRLQPISFGVGHGQIVGNIALNEKDNLLYTKADVDFRRVDMARLMSSTHVFGGAGSIGGRLELNTTGNSIAKMMANGNGNVKLFMTGGDLSALLVNLAGLDFGGALVSALGLPSRTSIRCMVTDLPLQRGILDAKLMLLDTDQANIVGKGTIDFRNETIDMQIDQQSKHFSIGSLPAPIDIRGRLKSPSILPDPVAVAARGGAAVALGVLLTPLAALLPTIQLGLGEDNDCGKLIAQAARSGPNKLTTKEIRSRTTR